MGNFLLWLILPRSVPLNTTFRTSFLHFCFEYQSLYIEYKILEILIPMENFRVSVFDLTFSSFFRSSTFFNWYWFCIYLFKWAFMFLYYFDIILRFTYTSSFDKLYLNLTGTWARTTRGNVTQKLQTWYLSLGM